MSIKKNDIFSLEFTTSGKNIAVSSSSQLAGEIPVSTSLTITRLV